MSVDACLISSHLPSSPLISAHLLSSRVLSFVCRSFTEESIKSLDALIQQQQRLFLKLYPAYMWKPKRHYTQHIPDQIRLFGPPR